MFLEVNYQNLDELYTTDNRPRYHELVQKFQEAYGSSPIFIARAPGRVNIIGQHIDYEGYGVLPAAIEKDCLIAVAVNQTPYINVRHVEPQTYPCHIFSTDPEAESQYINNYAKYFRAGYRAGVKQLSKNTLKGLNVMISGNVPISSGLSSSSALCVCSALAALHANGGTQGPLFQGRIQHFIERIIEGERETGTASGGMDQSISVMGKLNSCFYIQFHPIRCEAVDLPGGCRFIIMNSLVESAKLQTAVHRFNKRVCECRIAVNLLARKLGMEGSPKILKEIQSWSGLPLNNLSKLVLTFIQCRDYSQEELEGLLGQPLESILSDIPLHKEVLEANKVYKIWQASTHVFNEAYRVLEYIKVCNSKLLPRDKLTLLGNLMTQSQQSCRDLYECSCPEIDEITQLALKKGALGSRLTGAGWGGCTVSLVQADKAHQFMQSMIEDYYSKRPELQQKIKAIGIDNVVFESKPSQGACIVRL